MRTPPIGRFATHAAVLTQLSRSGRYENLNLGVDCDSRIALVGPNGACIAACHCCTALTPLVQALARARC